MRAFGTRYCGRAHVANFVFIDSGTSGVDVAKALLKDALS